MRSFKTKVQRWEHGNSSHQSGLRGRVIVKQFSAVYVHGKIPIKAEVSNSPSLPNSVRGTFIEPRAAVVGIYMVAFFDYLQTQELRQNMYEHTAAVSHTRRK